MGQGREADGFTIFRRLGREIGPLARVTDDGCKRPEVRWRPC